MKKILVIMACLISVCIFVGCEDESREKYMSDNPKLYYLSEDEGQIYSQDIEYEYDSKEKNVSYVLDKLKKGDYEKSKLPVIPVDVNSPSFSFSGEDVLTLKFDNSYFELDGVKEILTRAAIVMSLDCIDGVNYVEFVVNELPLTNADGIAIGAMSCNNFVDSVTNTINSVWQQELYLYYASEDGKILTKKLVKCESDINDSLESIILDALISGEGTDTKEIMRTINEDTVVNSVITKENICYVDLSKEFLDNNKDVTDEVYIYSVVNSLTELTFVNKVKFSIDGETVEKFNDKIDFDVLFERNLELVKQEQ